MKKIFNMLVVAFCSLAFLPMIASAASYEEFIDFAILSYDKENDSVSFTIELMKDMKVKNGIFSLEYQGVNDDGTISTMANNNFVYMGGTSLDDDQDGDLGDHIVGGVNNIAPDQTKIILHVNLEEYKGDLEIDLNNFIRDTNATYPASYPDHSSIVEKSTGLGADVEDIFVDVTENSTLDQNLLKKAMEDGVYLYASNGNEEKINYIWAFDGNQMERYDYDLNLGLTIGSSKNDKLISSLIPTSKDTPLHLEFAYHGELPKGTGVIINVGDKYNEKDKLTLYYFNEDTQKLEEVNTEIFYEGGYVGFELEHCSEYVLVKENAAPNNAQTSSMNVVLYATIATISFIGIIALGLSLRKKEMR